MGNNSKTNPNKMKTDSQSFDFAKWSSCMSEVLDETPDLLLSEADRQGEPVLRAEIADYLKSSRGVICSQEQVIVSAGSQQLINHIARLLKIMDIEHVCLEDPGYTPARRIFRDWGFSISSIPVNSDGLVIEKLPTNIRTAVYVCPHNQFPTGAVMPVEKRKLLVDWAAENDSLIIEDDYNTALSSPVEPIPTIHGIAEGRRAIYAGTFSPSLFPAVRISYMVLPKAIVELFDNIKSEYDQSCSKTEQLTLAKFMHKGYYQQNLSRVRDLYSKKIASALDAIDEYDEGGSFITVENTKSLTNMTLKIDTHARTISEGTSGKSRTEELYMKMTERMTQAAADLGIKIRGINQLSRDGQIYLILYCDQIPLAEITDTVGDLIQRLKSVLMIGSVDVPCVYEVIRIADGKPQFLPEHYSRLEGSLRFISKSVPFTYEELSAAIRALTEECNIVNHNIKLEVEISGHGLLYLNPTHYPSEEKYRDGVKTELFSAERQNPNVKIMDQALRDATDEAIKTHNLHEVILVDRDGNITEGSRSNIFFIKNGEVYTSPLHQVLPGITRGKIIEAAQGSGIMLHEQSIPASAIDTFDAAFISGTSAKVLPIASVGDVHYDVNDSVLREIMRLYDELSSK